MAKKKKKLVRPLPELEKEYWEDIELTDPLTGKKSIQKVKVKRYKTVSSTGSAPLEDDVISRLSSASSITYDDE